MKKRIVIAAILVFAIALFLFLPIPKGTYDDGGTRVYAATLYKIVVWNKLIAEVGEDGQATVTTYHKTSVFWMPDNLKDLDKLWQLEIADN